MDRSQLITILYLIASMLFFLTAILGENYMALPVGVLFLILAGLHSENKDEKAV